MEEYLKINDGDTFINTSEFVNELSEFDISCNVRRVTKSTILKSSLDLLAYYELKETYRELFGINDPRCYKHIDISVDKLVINYVNVDASILYMDYSKSEMGISKIFKVDEDTYELVYEKDFTIIDEVGSILDLTMPIDFIFSTYTNNKTSRSVTKRGDLVDPLFYINKYKDIEVVAYIMTDEFGSQGVKIGTLGSLLLNEVDKD